jgi:predicted kinase
MAFTMTRPKLYLFVGYPGAGKTTASKMIEQLTGATHLWADHVRGQMFGKPLHTATESHRLYERLNQLTGELLSGGQSVIYDTNFNFKHDRQALRQIATDHGAEIILIWITTPLAVARQRAIDAPSNGGTRVLGTMTGAEFDAIVAKLEPPTKSENPIKIDSSKLDITSLKHHLNL